MSYRLWLKEEIQRRKKRNLPYSLSAMARDLGITPAALSLVLSGRRHFSAKTLRIISRTLEWPEEKLQQALREAKPQKKKKNRVKSRYLSDEQFSRVSDWYFWAIISLASTPNNKASPKWIAARLGISESLAEQALQTLVDMQLMGIENGKMNLPEGTDVRFEPDSKVKTRRLHASVMKKALACIEASCGDESGDAEARVELFRVLPISSEALNAIEHHVRIFSNSVAKVGRENSGDDVYGIIVHALPLSKIGSKLEK